jgi:ABC-type glycerol-3-phosphate transport system permease component
VPVIATIALLHFFYIWNELRYASLYLGTRPDLWPISFSMQTASTFTGVPQAALQASALILMVVPVLILFLFQRFFMKDMVVTGLEK